MFARIKVNLTRQGKAMEVLLDLLREEFAHLTNRRPGEATRLEFSIQELIRQLAVERVQLKGLIQTVVPGAKRLNEIGAVLEPGLADEFSVLMGQLDATEQACAIQAEKNGQMATALLNQSKSLLDFMTREIQPKGDPTYSQLGRYGKNAKPQATIFRGRM